VNVESGEDYTRAVDGGWPAVRRRSADDEDVTMAMVMCDVIVLKLDDEQQL